MDGTVAYIALGSNLGDRLRLVTEALGLIDTAPGVRVARASSVWETEPVGVTEQPVFVNAAAELVTTLEPMALLEVLMAVERALGRDRAQSVRWGPRLIDLDLLLFGARRIATDALEVPHPRMLERAFVLAPLVELAAEVVHPVAGQTLGALSARVSDDGVRRVEGVALWPPAAAYEGGGRP